MHECFEDHTRKLVVCSVLPQGQVRISSTSTSRVDLDNWIDRTRRRIGDEFLPVTWLMACPDLFCDLVQLDSLPATKPIAWGADVFRHTGTADRREMGDRPPSRMVNVVANHVRILGERAVSLLEDWALACRQRTWELNRLIPHGPELPPGW